MKEVRFMADWTGKEEILKADGLTDNEIKVMIASRNNEYGDCMDGCTWSFTVCDNSGLSSSVYRGVVSSLIKKGFAMINGKRDDEVFCLTEAGKNLFNQEQKEEPVSDHKIEMDEEYKVKGYTNRWSVIDTYAGYALLENCTWGDEACYLVVKQNAKVENKVFTKKDGSKTTLPVIMKVVCETYDCLESALIDEGIL